jgi:hypothetical protein
MTTWFHRLRRMRQKLAAMTALNQAMREANIELTTQLEAAHKETAKWKAAHDNQVNLKRILMDRPDLEDRAERMQELLVQIEQLKSDYNQLLCRFWEITS